MAMNNAKTTMKGNIQEAKPTTLAMLLRKLTAPPPPSSEPNQEGANQTDWKKVPSRNRNRQNELEVPRTMLNGAATLEGVKPASKHRMPIRIKVAKPRGLRGDFSIGRILQAMLLAFQEVHPPTQLTTHNNRGPNISQVQELPEAEEELLNYMEAPNPKRAEFTGRIYIISDIGMNDFRRHDKLVNWLNREQISIERSDLRTTTPNEIGFILLASPAGDMLDSTP